MAIVLNQPGLHVNQKRAQETWTRERFSRPQKQPKHTP